MKLMPYLQLLLVFILGACLAVVSCRAQDAAESTLQPRSRPQTDLSTKSTATERSAVAEPEDQVDVRRIPAAEKIGSSRSDPQLESLLHASKRKTKFEKPTAKEVERFEQLFLRSLQNANATQELEQQWSADGWQLISWQSDDQSFAAICEAEGQQRGRGFFAFRRDSNSDLVLQAPHRFYDLGTGRIVAKMFQEQDVLAAAWNTIHRKQFDLAHRENHFFNAFTRAMIRYRKQAMIAQVHGFANEKQKGTGRTAELIVSDTTKFPGRLARSTAARFKQDFVPDKVRLFPIDTRSLGGTQNQQADVVRSAGSVGFLHLELNKSLRTKLQNSHELRAKFHASLAGSSLNSVESDRR